MKLKKTIVVLFILFVAGIMESCNSTDYYYTYTYKDIEVKNIAIIGNDIREVSNSVSKASYGIRIEFKFLKTDYYKLVEHTISPRLHLLQSSYATTVPYDTYHYKTEETITAIRIITLNDFDETHSAGSDVTHYFKLFRTYQTIEQYIASLANQTEYGGTEFHGYHEGFSPLADIENLLLMTLPTKGPLYKFKIEMDLSDGRTFEKETAEIELV